MSLFRGTLGDQTLEPKCQCPTPRSLAVRAVHTNGSALAFRKCFHIHHPLESSPLHCGGEGRGSSQRGISLMGMMHWSTAPLQMQAVLVHCSPQCPLLGNTHFLAHHGFLSSRSLRIPGADFLPRTLPPPWAPATDIPKMWCWSLKDWHGLVTCRGFRWTVRALPFRALLFFLLLILLLVCP